MNMRQPEKTAHVYQARISTARGAAEAGTPDWASELEEVSRLTPKERTVDGVIFDPVKVRDVWMLAMHKPVNRGFLTWVDKDSGSVSDWLEDGDSSNGRFAYSTVAAFMRPGISFALCKGDVSAPGHTAVADFLSTFSPLPQGEHWKTDPVIAEEQTGRFHQSNRAYWFKSTFSTRRDLWSDGLGPADVGIDTMANALADDVGGDLRVKITVQLERDQRTVQRERKFHDLIERSLPGTTRNDSKAEVRAIANDGLDEALKLVAHRMSVSVDLPPESTERQSFRDLLDGVYDVLPYLQNELQDIPRR